MLTSGLAVRAFAKGLIGASTESRVTAVPFRVDLNRASMVELQVLPGFGPSRAESIILERIRNGPFLRATDLQRVDGIGPGIVRAVEPYLIDREELAAGTPR